MTLLKVFFFVNIDLIGSTILGTFFVVFCFCFLFVINASGVEQALRVVLGGGAPSVDSKERLRATEWLQSFRRRDDAWDACVAGDATTKCSRVQYVSAVRVTSVPQVKVSRESRYPR